jgi:hypothetical protein
MARKTSGGAARRVRRARRGPTRQEPAIIAQADPTPEQRARYAYAVAATIDPWGETLVQGRVRSHRVCRRQPVYVTLHGRGVISDVERAALDWYDARLSLAQKGLTIDSIAIARRRGGAGAGSGRGGSGYTPTEAAARARSDVQWARGLIPDGEALGAFDAVMAQEMTFAEIAGGSRAKAARVAAAFRRATEAVAKGSRASAGAVRQGA